MKKTIMQITDYCIKGLEKQVGYRVCIDDLSIMNEVDELDVCEIIIDMEKEHGITFSQDISYIYDSVTQFIETLYNAQEEIVMAKKTIVGYQVRNKSNDGIRYASFFLAHCKDQCPYGCAVWSVCQKTYGIKLRFFWMSPFKKIGYDKYSDVVNFFHLHVGWGVMKREVPVEIVYEPAEETMEE